MSFPSPTNTALIIVGHGSTLNPDSSAPTHRCADEIRRRGLFAEVVCSFWKEEPSMREVFYTVESDTIFIVPNFISEGYFTREVLPRELRLDGPVTRRDGKSIFYCDPVGIHPTMTRLLLHRADEVSSGVARDQISLVIVGHGTALNEQSRKAIEAQVEFIRAGAHGFAEVLDAYMEEAPFVQDWNKRCSAPNAVVVPFFIADGLHSYQDIPVLLGLEAKPGAAASQNEVFRHNPNHVRGKNLYYSSAIGTDPLMVEVILDQVRDSAAKHPAPSKVNPATNTGFSLPQQTFTIGQVQCERNNAQGWVLHHTADSLTDQKLNRYSSVIDARELSLYDDSGEFRSLKTAPTLRRGWRLEVKDDSDLRLALDFLYPGALGLLQHFQDKTLQPVSLRETLGRQTGMYRFSNSISDAEAEQMVAEVCDPHRKCQRRITWQLDRGRPLSGLPPEKLPPLAVTQDDLPLICVEGCTHLVSAAREIARAKTRSGT